MGQTDERTVRHYYHVHYLLRFMVDKDIGKSMHDVPTCENALLVQTNQMNCTVVIQSIWVKRHYVRNPGGLRNHYVAFLQNMHGMGQVRDPTKHYDLTFSPSCRDAHM